MNKLETFKNVGWIEHDGRGCPVNDGTLVRIRYEARVNCVDGELLPDILEERTTFVGNSDCAGEWEWVEGDSDNISHYQILELGRTVEGDPIVVGAEYETEDYGICKVIGWHFQGDLSKVCIPTVILYFYHDGEAVAVQGFAEEDLPKEKQLMRLHRPEVTKETKQPREIVLDGVKYREVIE